MKSRNETKSLQLGMDYGTASNRLRKQVLYMLVKKCNLDTCYRCGNKIQNINDLSVEHKTPWLHSEDPKQVFFNLDNIAFSHKKCNYSCKRRTTRHHNKTGYMGVRYNGNQKLNRHYEANIVLNKKEVYLGIFNTPEEASIAYKNATP